MSWVWKTIFIVGALLFAGMAVYAIWYEALAPIKFAKVFLTLIIGGVVLSVLESLLTKGKPSDGPG